jgi:hypothetical protein
MAERGEFHISGSEFARLVGALLPAALGDGAVINPLEERKDVGADFLVWQRTSLSLCLTSRSGTPDVSGGWSILVREFLRRPDICAKKVALKDRLEMPGGLHCDLVVPHELVS